VLRTDWNPSAVRIGDPTDGVDLAIWTIARCPVDELDSSDSLVTREERFLAVIEASPQVFAPRCANDDALDLRAIRDLTVADHDATRLALRLSTYAVTAARGTRRHAPICTDSRVPARISS
jgi:hypothetical protein